MNLIGLTINESIKEIQKKEGNRFYQIYVILKEHKERNFKEFYKKNHLHNKNGKRVYRIVDFDLWTYANNEQLEKDNFVIDVEIEKGQHDNWSFSSYVSTSEHNIYNLFVDHITKGNKGAKYIKNKKERLIEYKDGELTKAQRRFTL